MFLTAIFLARAIAQLKQAGPAEDLAILIAARADEHATVGPRLQEMRDLTAICAKILAVTSCPPPPGTK